MTAISLWQPWATLIAIGAKAIETRGWETSYRGPLAIHAAKNVSELGICAANHFWQAFHQAQLWSIPNAFTDNFSEAELRQHFAYNLRNDKRLEWLPLPLGAIVAVAELVDCVPSEEIRDSLSNQERGFGDYSNGRWGWKLEGVRALDEPVPWVGSQRLFTVDIPTGALR